MKRKRVRATGLALALLLALVAALGQRSSRAAGRQRPLADFNNDEYEDLVVGVPYEDWGDDADDGCLLVLYGRPGEGLSNVGGWGECPGEAYDHFGRALAVGDFDADGYTDLAVGVPGQTVGGEVDAGAVHVFYGWDAGLTSARDQVWHQDTGAVGSTAEPYDHFGWTLAAGDFDGDGRDDLAVGVPHENWNEDDAGIVQILYGSADGLTDAGHQLWRQGANGIADGEEMGDRFGDALASADFDGDGYADLAVGVPSEDLEDPSPTKVDAGAVHAIYGSPFGLSATDNALWHQSAPGTADQAEEDDAFGWALTTGDFDGDGWADLAVGVPGQSVGTEDGAGAVHILYGGWDGLLTKSMDKVLDEDDLASAAEGGNHFGRALTAADFDGDGYSDLAVGVPGQDLPGLDDVGWVYVLYGAPGGPSAIGFHSTCQCGPFEDALEDDDHYGEVLAGGDFDGDGYADLAVGVPYEDLELGPESLVNAGAVHIVYGSGSGVTPTGDQFWYEDNVFGGSEAGDTFGFALAAIPSVRPKVRLPLVLRNAR